MTTIVLAAALKFQCHRCVVACQEQVLYEEQEEEQVIVLFEQEPLAMKERSMMIIQMIIITMMPFRNCPSNPRRRTIHIIIQAIKCWTNDTTPWMTQNLIIGIIND
jgi:hypothetical protein